MNTQPQSNNLHKKTLTCTTIRTILPFISKASEIVGKKILIQFNKSTLLMNFNKSILSKNLETQVIPLAEKINIESKRKMKEIINMD